VCAQRSRINLGGKAFARPRRAIGASRHRRGLAEEPYKTILTQSVPASSLDDWFAFALTLGEAARMSDVRRAVVRQSR
jgi:hypothetical protein